MVYIPRHNFWIDSGNWVESLLFYLFWVPYHSMLDSAGTFAIKKKNFLIIPLIDNNTLFNLQGRKIEPNSSPSTILFQPVSASWPQGQCTLLACPQMLLSAVFALLPAHHCIIPLLTYRETENKIPTSWAVRSSRICLLLVLQLFMQLFSPSSLLFLQEGKSYLSASRYSPLLWPLHGMLLALFTADSVPRSPLILSKQIYKA